MKYDDWNPTPATAARAAKIWRMMLENPKYDNGAEGLTGLLLQSLASKYKSNATPEILDAFEKEMTALLLTPDENGYCETYFSCDYGPDVKLSQLAEKVGLEMQFPIKTSMNIHPDYVSYRFGYSAPWIYHYLLSNGRWLVTTLSGQEIEAVKKHLVDGAPFTWTVEDSSTIKNV